MVLFRLHTTAADVSGQRGSPVTWRLIYTIVLTDQFTQITKEKQVFSLTPCGIEPGREI